jgi:hypothetical protein
MPIDLPPVADILDDHNSGGGIKFVDNAVVTDTMTPGSCRAGQFFVWRYTGSVSQLFNGLKDMLNCCGGELAQVFFN